MMQAIATTAADLEAHLARELAATGVEAAPNPFGYQARSPSPPPVCAVLALAGRLRTAHRLGVVLASAQVAPEGALADLAAFAENLGLRHGALAIRMAVLEKAKRKEGNDGDGRILEGL